jgi:hypothetical protein
MPPQPKLEPMKSIGLRLPILVFATFLFTSSSYSQFNWNTIDDSISLSPEIYSINGGITISFLGKVITEDNKVYIDFKSKNVYVNNYNNMFKFPFDQVGKIYITDLEEFNGSSLFETELKESIIKSHRKQLYHGLDLNLATFTYSKKNKIDMTKEGKLFVKNEKQRIGKICAVGLNFAIIVTESGELLSMGDGDFNSLTIANTSAKDCKTLYNLIFNYFQKELDTRIDSWEQDVLTLDVNSLVNRFGPIHTIKEVSPEIKQYEWKWPKVTYQVNISTSSKQFGIGNFTRQSNYSGNTFSSIYGSVTGSSLFAYGNSYRTANLESSSFGITSTITNTSQNGDVVMSDEGSSITLIKDKNGKSTLLFHTNIFSELGYGKPFKFIEY